MLCEATYPQPRWKAQDLLLQAPHPEPLGQLPNPETGGNLSMTVQILVSCCEETFSASLSSSTRMHPWLCYKPLLLGTQMLNFIGVQTCKLYICQVCV
jgi:hypothetical protein